MGSGQKSPYLCPPHQIQKCWPWPPSSTISHAGAAVSMDEEPLLPTFHRPLSAAGRRRLSSTPPSPTLFSLPESQEVTHPLPTSPRPPSLKHLLIFGSPDDPAPPLSPAGVGAPADDLQWQLFRAKSNLHRSKTAPAMATINDIDHSEHDHDQPPPSPVSPSIVRQAFLLLLLYLSLGVVIYYLNRHQFAAAETHPVVDALYFCIVTMCTIGYGDITPSSPATKLFSILFVLVGFGFIDILLSGVVSYVLDIQEKLLLTAVKGSAGDGGGEHSYLVDVKKGRMRIRMKVALALGVVVICVGVDQKICELGQFKLLNQGACAAAGSLGWECVRRVEGGVRCVNGSEQGLELAWG